MHLISNQFSLRDGKLSTMTTIEIVRGLDAFIPFMENNLTFSNWKLLVDIYFENYQLQMEVKADI